MRLLFALFAVGFASVASPSAYAQYQAVVPLCGDPAAPCTNSNPLPVAPTSGGGTSNVNVVQFGSNNVVTGTGAGGVGIPRVTVSNDSTVGLVAGTTTAVTQPTAANLNATVVGTGTFAVQAAQSGNWTARIVGNGGATLDATVAPGTAPTNMQVSGGIYNVTAPTPSDTQSLALQLDETGRLRTTAQPASANMVTGTANTTSTGTTSLIGLVSAKRIYTTAFSCANTGASASLISFQDGSGGSTLWTTIVPAGGGSNLDGNQPLFKTTAGNALFFAAATASTTIYCSAAGYSGS